MIAVMRLAMPDRLIPASLDVEGIAGLEARLEAGANVVTSIVPPQSGLAGVSQAELDIDAGLRTAPGSAAPAGAGARGGRRRRVRRAGWRRSARSAASPSVTLHETGGRRRQAAGHRGLLPGLKAGYEVVLIDRRPACLPPVWPPRRHVFDVTEEEARARELMARATPCCRPARTTRRWPGWRAACPAWDVPLLFDLGAYGVTSSKLAPERLIRDWTCRRPLPWPACGLPAVVKPSSASGSEGVRVVRRRSASWRPRGASWSAAGHEAVVEEFVAGPSLSLEVIAWGGRAVPLLGTELEFDAPTTASG